MKLFELRADKTNERVVVDFGAKNNEKLTDALIYGEFEFDEITSKSLSAESQVEDFNAIFRNSDYFESVVSLPIFSRKAKLALEVLDDLVFYEIEIDGIEEFYICKIARSEDIVDFERSQYSTLTDGRKVLSSPAFKVPKNDFFVTKDSNYEFIFLASDKFMEFCSKKNLRIRFIEITPGQVNSFF